MPYTPPLTKHEEVARVGNVDHPYHGEEPVASKEDHAVVVEKKLGDRGNGRH